MKRENIVFDCELIGQKKPVFLVRTRNKKTGERQGFWWHKRGDMKRLLAMFDDPKYTWESFNGIKFDAPIIAAAVQGHDPENLKIISTKIIEEKMQPWEVYKFAGIEPLQFDHIDWIEVAPGTMTSLKTYMGRMHYPTLVDMPVHHDTDLTPKQLPMVESYCDNDTGGTAALSQQLQEQLNLRIELGERYGLDLRSKSDAQVAEAIIKKVAGISGKPVAPSYVEYFTPAFIKTKNTALLALIQRLEEHCFKINYANGAVIAADWMEEELLLGGGSYKVGIGGLHSTHDVKLYRASTETVLISDFDVASYYPTMILQCGYIPRISGNKGEAFIDTFRDLYDERLQAKRDGNKKVANTLKIALNGTYGKLGSIYSSFYSPDLMLAVTLTGQLNLLCLIDELTRIKGVEVLSANTDGICVSHPITAREKVLKVFTANSKRTKFEYEETSYKCIAMKDVNNYLAITLDGKVKSKGLYAECGLQKNPTMEVCSKAARQFLIDGTKPEVFIKKQKDVRDFVAVRGVTGGGVQHLKTRMVDDWYQIDDGQWARPEWPNDKAPVKRKSRPPAVEEGYGGTPFGRVARWYMTTEQLPPITYVGSGNKVPKTEGAKLLMTLPERNKLPPDLDLQWYVRETYEMLSDMGVSFARDSDRL